MLHILPAAACAPLFAAVARAWAQRSRRVFDDASLPAHWRDLERRVSNRKLRNLGDGPVGRGRPSKTEADYWLEAGLYDGPGASCSTPTAASPASGRSRACAAAARHLFRFLISRARLFRSSTVFGESTRRCHRTVCARLQGQRRAPSGGGWRHTHVPARVAAQSSHFLARARPPSRRRVCWESRALRGSRAAAYSATPDSNTMVSFSMWAGADAWDELRGGPGVCRGHGAVGRFNGRNAHLRGPYAK